MFIGILFSVVPRCPNLAGLSNETLTVIHDDNPRAGTVATYNCTRGVVGNVNRRTCECAGTWSQPEPVCIQPEGRKNSTCLLCTPMHKVYIQNRSTKFYAHDIASHFYICQKLMAQ